MKWMSLLSVLLLCVVSTSAWSEPARKQLRVYHIGNSVTDTLKYQAFGRMVASRGHGYVWGRHMIPGCPLWGLWMDQGGFQEKPYGASRNALTNFDWDVVTLQPFDRLLDKDIDPDLPSCEKFIELIVARKPDTQVFIYARWPRRDEVKGSQPIEYQPLDYQAKWARPYSGKWDQSFEARDYFHVLADALNKKFEGKLVRPVRVLPVGDVLAELDRRIRAGEVEGLSSIEQIYTDHIHLNHVGSYAVGATFFATLYNESAVGLPTQAYGQITEPVARAIGESVDKVLGLTPAQ
jgi:hypothetical protein